MNNLSFSRTGSPKNKKLAIQMGKDLGFDLTPLDKRTNKPMTDKEYRDFIKKKSLKGRKGFVLFLQKKDKYLAIVKAESLYIHLCNLCIGKSAPLVFLDRLEKIHAKEMAKKSKR